MKLNHIRRNRGLTMTALAGVSALVWASIAGAATAGGTQAVPQGADPGSVRGAYGQLPLSFIHNNGQVDAKVKFYEKGSGHATYFTTDGVYLSLTKGRPSSSPTAADSSLIALRPQGANPNVHIVADHEQAGKVNYLVGRDPGQWQTNVPTYGAVVYQEIYRGIDLTFYGNNRQLEYDFVVKPGADPRNVRLAYEGIQGLRVTDTGDLEIALNGGVILQRKPVVYQMINGQRVDVAGVFTIQTPVQQGSQAFAYGFNVASYDTTQPLVIDPTLVYSTYLGGGDSDIGNSVAVDAAGNAYVAGKTQSVNFPTSGPLQAGLNGGSDLFVTKLNPTGTAAVYATYLGGSGADEAAGIAVDAAGNAYVTGRTSSSDFPTASPMQATSGGGTDAFLVKLAPTGATLVYATYLGGGGTDFGMGVAVDGAGNTYVTGQTQSSDFPTAPTAGALQPTLASANGDGFVAKVNAAGAALVYSTYLGGGGADTGNGIAVDVSGNAYVAGETQSADFPTTSALQPTFGGGGSDAFITKLNPVGSLIVYSTYLGGSGSDAAHGIAVGPAASAFVTGATQSPNFPTVNAVQSTPGGLTDAFVARFGTAGAPLLYSTYLGGSNDDVGLGIAVDASSNAYATGKTASADFPVASPLQATPGGAVDAFVARLNATGTAFGYSTYFGGNGLDEGRGIAVDAAGNAYLTGMTESSNLDTVNPMQGVFAGTQDAFAAKISPLNELTVVKAGNGNGTVTSSPSGINCGATCSAFFGPGALVSLTALPVPPAAFTGWSGACSGVSSCVVTMDASKSVTATFSIPEPTVTRVSPSPVIYGVTPSQSITIYGSSFVVGARITVGSLTGTTVAGFVASAATPFVRVSSGQLAFYWPNTTLPPGSYSVQVANPASVGGGSGSLADAFVVTAPQPAITNLTPATVLYGTTPSQSITIYGSNFAPGAQITVGSLTGTTVAGSVASATAPFVYVTRTQLKFYWANTVLPAGAYTVQVTNPAVAGGLSGSLANGLTVGAPQPAVRTLTPGTVLYGVTPSQSVTIFGSSFVLGSRITVGGLTGATVAGTLASAATPFVYVSSNQLRFYWPNTSLPPNAYAVQVTNPAAAGGQSGSLANGFTVAAPQPTVRTLTPASVVYGVRLSQSVTVFGSNFVPGARITVGSLTGTTVPGSVATASVRFVHVSSTQVKFYWPNTSLPPNAYAVQVTNPAAAGGQSGSLANGFTVNAPQPTITSLAPAGVVYGVTPSISVSVSGTNFVLGSRITVGGLTGATVAGTLASAATPFVYVSSNQLRFYWPNTSLPPNAYAVQVTNPAAAGGQSGSLANGFTVTSPEPVIRALSPSTLSYGVAPSQSITVFGSNFSSGARITVGSLTGTTVPGSVATAGVRFVYVSSTQLKFYWPNTSLPPNAYAVQVTNPAAAGGQSGSLANGFTVNAPQPTITSLAPPGVVYGVSPNLSITVFGTNFVLGSQITVGGLTGTTVPGSVATASARFVYVNSTQVKFYWPNTSLPVGSYTVDVTNPGIAGGLSGSRANGFTVNAPQPTIMRLSPSTVLFGMTPNQSVTIQGTNFVVGSRITVGGLTGTTVAGTVASAATPFVYVSSSQVRFYWPNTSLPLGSYVAEVTNPTDGGGLGASLNNAFTVTLPALLPQ